MRMIRRQPETRLLWPSSVLMERRTTLLGLTFQLSGLGFFLLHAWGPSNQGARIFHPTKNLCGKNSPLLDHSRPLTRPAAQPVTEEELAAIFERLDAARDIFSQNRELREVLSCRQTETQALQSRNAELEEILRKFAPMLLDMATTMGLAAKNEEPDTPSQPLAPQ
jgi:hypothetical protein